MINEISSQIPDYGLRLIAAGVFGAILGLERDMHGRPAGLRTHILVSIGSALFMVVSISVAVFFGKGYPADPARIAAQIITGIGFIGAGTIIKEGFSIRGLTTASCLWVAAGIGMASGAGFYLMALLVTLISLFTLLVLNRIERFYRHDNFPSLTLTMPLNTPEKPIFDLLTSLKMKLVSMDITKDKLSDMKTIKIYMRAHFSSGTPLFSQELMAALDNLTLDIRNIVYTNRDMRE